MRRPLLAATATTLIALAAPPAPAGETFRDDAHGFAVEVPPRWDSTSAAAVAGLSVAVQKATKHSINYLACFVPAGRTASDLPRILVQWQSWPEPPPSYEALNEFLAREMPGVLKKTESSLPIKLQSLESGGHFIDRAKNRLVLRMRASVLGVGTVEAVSFGMLGQKGTAFLHCYASRDQFEKTLPLFEQFADTFHFDAGQEYKPDPNASAAGWSRVGRFDLGPAVASGLIGGLVAGAVALGQKLRRKAA
jgi:hypothetical protein